MWLTLVRTANFGIHASTENCSEHYFCPQDRCMMFQRKFNFLKRNIFWKWFEKHRSRRPFSPRPPSCGYSRPERHTRPTLHIRLRARHNTPCNFDVAHQCSIQQWTEPQSCGYTLTASIDRVHILSPFMLIATTLHPLEPNAKSKSCFLYFITSTCLNHLWITRSKNTTPFWRYCTYNIAYFIYKHCKHDTYPV